MRLLCRAVAGRLHLLRGAGEAIAQKPFRERVRFEDDAIARRCKGFACSPGKLTADEAARVIPAKVLKDEGQRSTRQSAICAGTRGRRVA